MPHAAKLLTAGTNNLEILSGNYSGSLSISLSGCHHLTSDEQ